MLLLVYEGLPDGVHGCAVGEASWQVELTPEAGPGPSLRGVGHTEGSGRKTYSGESKRTPMASTGFVGLARSVL